MPDLGPYLLEVVPDQNTDAEADAVYELAFTLQVPATPTPVPVVEEPTPAPTPTPVPVPVPPVVARPANEAVDRVRAVGLAPRAQTADRYSPAGPGTIAAQDPPAGTLVAPGAPVTLLVASGNVAVPAVVGMTEQDASTALHEAGFEIDTRRARRSNVDAGRAADVNPGQGNALPAGSTVILTISQGP
jgi:serine/threonine-protein kinase